MRTRWSCCLTRDRTVLLGAARTTGGGTAIAAITAGGVPVPPLVPLLATLKAERRILLFVPFDGGGTGSGGFLACGPTGAVTGALNVGNVRGDATAFDMRKCLACNIRAAVTGEADSTLTGSLDPPVLIFPLVG